MIIKADEHYVGRNIKSVLAELHFSAKAISAMKRDANGILVNGEHKTVRYILEKNDILELNFEDASFSAIVPKDSPIDILYEDDWLLCVNKPPFLPVHPSRHHQDDTLAARVINLYRGRPFVFRCITRLDADTSGVVIIAKNRLSASVMAEDIAAHRIKKEYIAVCHGYCKDSIRNIDFNIRRPDSMNIKRQALPHGAGGCETSPNGCTAFTSFSTISTNGTHSLLEVFPLTGRTHQIRVHLSAIDMPIVGDWLYGTKSHLIERHALHAKTLEFTHPKTKELLRITAPLHNDMNKLIAALCLNKGGKDLLL